MIFPIHADGRPGKEGRRCICKKKNIYIYVKASPLPPAPSLLSGNWQEWEEWNEEEDPQATPGQSVPKGKSKGKTKGKKGSDSKGPDGKVPPPPSQMLSEHVGPKSRAAL